MTYVSSGYIQVAHPFDFLNSLNSLLKENSCESFSVSYKNKSIEIKFSTNKKDKELKDILEQIHVLLVPEITMYCTAIFKVISEPDKAFAYFFSKDAKIEYVDLDEIIEQSMDSSVS
jgi:hypothetical protein